MDHAAVAPSPPSPVRVATVSLALLALGLLAFSLWPQEFRFEREIPGGRERVAVYTRWGCVVKEVILDEGGAVLRSRSFPLGEIPFWSLGSLPHHPDPWQEETGRS